MAAPALRARNTPRVDLTARHAALADAEDMPIAQRSARDQLCTLWRSFMQIQSCSTTHFALSSAIVSTTSHEAHELRQMAAHRSLPGRPPGARAGQQPSLARRAQLLKLLPPRADLRAGDRQRFKRDQVCTILQTLMQIPSCPATYLALNCAFVADSRAPASGRGPPRTRAVPANDPHLGQVASTGGTNRKEE
jgi:hypothetical protein